MNLADFINDILVIKSNKAETSVAVCNFVVGQHGILDMTELLEVGTDVFQAGRRRQSTHKDLFGAHHKFRIGFPWYSDFGLHDFSIQLKIKGFEILYF